MNVTNAESMTESAQIQTNPAECPVADSEAATGFDFAAVIQTWQTPLLRYTGRLLGGIHDETEDVVQEAFMRLHQEVKAHGYDSIRNIRVWLFRVAHNLSMDVGRKRTRRQNKQERVAQHEADRAARTENRLDGLGEMLRREATGKALEALQQLPEGQRQVILLKIIQDMTLREIAEVVGITPSNVNYRLNQGLKTMAAQLKRDGVL
ncbi:MAG: RNA polymerase sigma factor [Planctomycetota bacterium]|jgi:RNA polymerase sigma-70 factor (ECF subfamily)